MNFNIHKLSVVQLQWLVWACVFFMVLFTTLAEDPFSQAITFTILNTSFYAAIVYGNISFLYPRFYEKNRTATYIVCSVFYVILIALARGFVAMYIYNHYFAKQQEKLTGSLIFAFIAGAALDFIISLIFRVALAYFKLKQQSEEIILQKSQAELKLLKSQVQPHFLFNTLNNIYYEAYTEAPKTAALIEKLSEIMRYLVDESPREQVLLSAEINFLENYISLERIRVRNDVHIAFDKKIGQDLMLPPMLLMPFVENIFKHGIDKSGGPNQIEVSLAVENNYLYFHTINKIIEGTSVSHGFGLKNLKERLTLLYADNYELTCKSADSKFFAYLKIPAA